MAPLLVAVAAHGCASAVVAPIGDGGRPFRPEADERRLWEAAATEEAALARPGLVYEDARLAGYLTAVASRLVPPAAQAAGGPPVRVTVLRDPALNAFAMPDGAVYVHTGLLARLGGEAQLAAILAHEVAHVIGRHALVLARAGSAGPATAPTGALAALPLAARAAVEGSGRPLERAAATASLERLVEAGYDPREAAAALERLREDHGDPARIERFLLGNPARVSERLAHVRELLRTRWAALDADPLVRSTGEFDRRMRVVARDNAGLDLRAGRFSLARAQLDRAAALAPDDPATHLGYGDLYRLQAQHASGPGAAALRAEAQRAYERAAALDPAYPDPHRQLGLLYYQAGQTARARAAFERYLALAPQAADGPRIREYLVELGR